MKAEISKTHVGADRAQLGGRPGNGKTGGAAASPIAAVQTREADFKLIPRASIDPSKTNPRKDFGDLAGLAGSIEQQGIIEPLVVRPKAKGRFEIVAGERRYRAAALAELETLPCIVRALSDADAIEIQGIENIQRQNLKPLEEAAQYRLLIDTKPDKFSAEVIAKKQGKSPSWVWDVMKILDLIPEAKTLLDEGRISINHAIPIARLTPAQQKMVIERPGGLFQSEGHTLFDDDDKGSKSDKYDGMKPRSVKELQTYIAEHIRFNPKHAAQAAPLLFDNVAQQVADAEKRPGRGKKVIAITHNSYVQPDAKDPNERTFSAVSWERADGEFNSKVCDSSVLGVVVAGRGYGEAFEVCVARDKCTVHFGHVIRAKEKRQREATKTASAGNSPAANSKPKSAAAIEKEKQRLANQELAQKAEDLADDLIQKAALDKLRKLPKKLPSAVFARVLAALRNEVSSREFSRAQGVTQDNLAHTLAVCIAKTDIQDCYEEDEWAVALGVDVKKLRAGALAQVKSEAKAQTSGEAAPAKKAAKKKARK